MIVDPPDGKVPVMRWAEDKRDYDLERLGDSWVHETPWVRCITRGVPGGMFRLSMAGTLVGLDLPAASKNLELKPYGISRVTSDLAARPPTTNHPGGDAGIDAKYGVTANLTADQLTADGTALKQLQDQSATADGQMRALQVGHSLASLQADQIMKLRALIAQQTVMFGEVFGRQQAIQEQQQAVEEKYFKTDTLADPTAGKQY